MSFLPSSRTKRRLLKVASLGLAGLLAGLFAGCTSSPETTAKLHPVPAPGDALSTDPSTDASGLPTSIEATQIPSLRHPPSARRLQLGAMHTSAQALLPSGRNGY